LIALDHYPAFVSGVRPRGRPRIGSIAAFNTIVVVVLAGLIWNGSRLLNSHWEEVRRLHYSDALLTLLGTEAARLQSLIHEYISEQRPETFAEILLLREAVLGTLKTKGGRDPLLSANVPELAGLTGRFLGLFGDLRALQSTIVRSQEEAVFGPARNMAVLLADIEKATASREALITPVLTHVREDFAAVLVAANAYYRSSGGAAQDAMRRIEEALPAMRGRADNDEQIKATDLLQREAAAMRDGLDKVAGLVAERTSLMQRIDSSQADMIVTIDSLSLGMHRREQEARERFDESLVYMHHEVVLATIICLAAMLGGSIVVAQSIRLPLRRLMAAMGAISQGRYEKPILGTSAGDEIGDMARAVEVFRENAIAKDRAEAALRAAKEHAERTLAELRSTQRDLIQAEKLAALGGLVAGIAHEVNNPVGISLTVASSFARRCERFADELKTPPLRRSSLEEFVEKSHAAADQLVANLQRAGELILSFKQVAVDRQHAERREFDLAEATDQIIASLRPVLRKLPLELVVDVPKGISMNSYPGSYGQVLTNLFLNTVAHAFPDGRAGMLTVTARPVSDQDVEIAVADDGVGMTDEVRLRAFDPFFTTRRNHGGTGLGLHVIFNIVTQSLGGRLALDSAPGGGTTFRIKIPRHAAAAAATME
jgi:signal transduction histidine kinase